MGHRHPSYLRPRGGVESGRHCGARYRPRPSLAVASATCRGGEQILLLRRNRSSMGRQQTRFKRAGVLWNRCCIYADGIGVVHVLLPSVRDRSICAARCLAGTSACWKFELERAVSDVLWLKKETFQLATTCRCWCWTLPNAHLSMRTKSCRRNQNAPGQPVVYAIVLSMRVFSPPFFQCN